MSARESSTRPLDPPPSKPVAENICTVIVNDWVNDDYKHLVLDAPPTALTIEPGGEDRGGEPLLAQTGLSDHLPLVGIFRFL